MADEGKTKQPVILDPEVVREALKMQDEMPDGVREMHEKNRQAMVRFNAFVASHNLSRDELLKMAGGTVPDTGNANKKPPLQQLFQEQEILRVIGELSYDPKNLPKQAPGKSGVKAEVRAKLLFSSGVFNKAWDRLRASRDIQDAE